MDAREASSATNGALAENVHGIRAIQELTREPLNADLFEEKARRNLNTHLCASAFTNVMIPIVDTLTGAAMAIIIVIGGAMVLNRESDIGVMVAFLFYTQRFFDPIRSLTIQYSTMQRAWPPANAFSRSSMSRSMSPTPPTPSTRRPSMARSILITSPLVTSRAILS